MSDDDLVQYIRTCGIYVPPITIAFRFDVSWQEARARCKRLVQEGRLRERAGRYKVKVWPNPTRDREVK